MMIKFATEKRIIKRLKWLRLSSEEQYLDIVERACAVIYDDSVCFSPFLIERAHCGPVASDSLKNHLRNYKIE